MVFSRSLDGTQPIFPILNRRATATALLWPCGQRTGWRSLCQAGLESEETKGSVSSSKERPPNGRRPVYPLPFRAPRGERAQANPPIREASLRGLRPGQTETWTRTPPHGRTVSGAFVSRWTEKKRFKLNALWPCGWWYWYSDGGWHAILARLPRTRRQWNPSETTPWHAYAPNACPPCIHWDGEYSRWWNSCSSCRCDTGRPTAPFLYSM